MAEQNDGRGKTRQTIYQISIVAQMVDTHPQTLRTYEKLGLISPQRAGNNVRIFNDDDVELVRKIQHLTQDLGVNLAGVEVIFKLLREIESLNQKIEELEKKRK